MSRITRLSIVVLIVTSMLVLLGAAVPSASASSDSVNDDIDTATPISYSPYYDYLDTTSATIAYDDPIFPCGSSDTGSETVWYEFTVAHDNTTVYANTFDSDYDTMLALWSGSRGSLTNLACNDDTVDWQSEIAVTVPAGTYYLEVAEYGAEAVTAAKVSEDEAVLGGNLGLYVELAPPPPPPNDDIDAATPVSYSPFYDYTDTTGATIAYDDPVFSFPCGSGDTGSETVWYVFTVAHDNTTVYANTFDSDYDTMLALWSGSRGSLTNLACNDDAGGWQSEISLTVPAGTYYLEVADYGAGAVTAAKVSEDEAVLGGNLGLYVELTPPPPPPNDDIDNVTYVADRPFYKWIDASGASIAGDDPVFPCGSNDTGSHTIWYEFYVEDDTRVYADTNGSDYDTMLALWSGWRGSMVNHACDDDSGGDGLQSIIDVVVPAGTYYLEVADYGSWSAAAAAAPAKPDAALGPGAVNGGYLNLFIDLTPPPPPNDDIDAAAYVADRPFYDWMDAYGATVAGDDPVFPCGSSDTGSHTIWYEFYVEDDTRVYADTIGSNYDTMLALWSGSRGSMVNHACDDDSSVNGLQSIIDVVVPAGTYYLEVADYGNWSVAAAAAPAKPDAALSPGAVNGGYLNLLIDLTPSPPPNDDIDAATAISVHSFYDWVDTYGATIADDDPVFPCGSSNTGSETVWYEFDVAQDDTVIYANTFDSDYDTMLALWSGSRGALTNLACNDDAIDWQSEIRVTVPAGTYYLEVANYGAGSVTAAKVSEGEAVLGGWLGLFVEITPPPPPNDDMDDATEIDSSPFSDDLDTYGATGASDDPIFPCVTGSAGSKTVWYEFTVDQGNTVVNANTFDSDYDTILALWSGSRGALTNLACSDDAIDWQSEIEVAVPAGTYYLEVAEYGAGPVMAAKVSENETLSGGNLALDVTLTPVCYTLSSSVVPDEAGSIEFSPAPNCGGGLYHDGTEVTLTATPNSRFSFTSWGGDVDGVTPNVAITMDDDKSVTANFTGCCSLNTDIEPSGSGTVAVSPAPNCEGGFYVDGTEVSLIAMPESAFTFDHWSGDVGGASQTLIVTMDADKSVCANMRSEQMLIFLPVISRE